MTGPCPETGPRPQPNYASGITRADRGAGALACGPYSSLLDLGAWLTLRAQVSAGVPYAA